MNEPQEIANNLYSFYDVFRSVLPTYSGKNQQFSWVKNKQGFWPNMVYAVQNKEKELSELTNQLSDKLPPFWVVNNDENGVETGIYLKNNGLREINQWSGMVLTKDMLKPTTKVNTQIVIKKITTIAELSAWVEVLNQELFSGQQTEKELFEKVFTNQQFNFYGAYFNDELVATLLSFHSEKSCGLYLIATKKSFRKQGIATNLVQQSIHDAFEIGKSNIVLQASKAGENVYKNLGFEKYGTFSVYWKLEIRDF